MRDISVMYLSWIARIPGMGHYAHTHDYWHFSLVLEGRYQGEQNTEPRCYCRAAGELNVGAVCVENCGALNVMFLVHDKNLSRKLAVFPFSQLSGEELQIPVLMGIFDQAHELKPSQSFIDFAFGYYLHLLMESPKMKRDELPHGEGLVEKALEFIEAHYMDQIRLEDIAEHIGRTPQHTSHLVKTVTGMTPVEHIREVRIRNACQKLAYSSIPTDEIISSCGFISASYFHRVFREKMGTTPSRYRTSHMVKDTFYHGEESVLDVPHQKRTFTYVPGARKCIDWRTPREYLNQFTVDFEEEGSK